MTDTTHTRLLVEKRFPLNLSVSINSIRELYEQAKLARWNPGRDISWQNFDSSNYTAEVLKAARTSWSRRIWTEHSRLTETPAMLIRLCLELGREADPKYFLTVRGTEEAWHIECGYQLCELLGGFVSGPSSAQYANIFKQRLFQKALNAETWIDGYMAAEGACRDAIELALYRGYLQHTKDPVVKQVLQNIVNDKTRHTEFSWLYIEQRTQTWKPDDYQRATTEIMRYIQDVEFQGFHCAWLAKENTAEEVVSADEITTVNGLGALSKADEIKLFTNTINEIRKRFNDLSVTLPKFHHSMLGDI